MPRESGLPHGTLMMLVLRVLTRQPLHGYAIAQRIHQLSADELHIEEGSWTLSNRSCWSRHR